MVITKVERCLSYDYIIIGLFYDINTPIFNLWQ